MDNTAASRQSALHGHEIDLKTGRLNIVERRPQALGQINGITDPAILSRALGTLKLNSTPSMGRVVSGDRFMIFGTGPDAWFFESQQDGTVEAVRDALSNSDGSVTDLSHARTIFTLSGRAAVDLLARGCALDIEKMQPGDATLTNLSHLNVLLHRVADDVFELYVFRSFAVALREWLDDAATEYQHAG